MGSADKEPEYMTRSAYQRLLEKRNEIETKLREAERSVGKAVGRRGDWHDNPAYDAAVEEVRYWSARLQQVEDILHRARILESPSRTDVVQIGSRVKVSIEGEAMEIILGGSMEGDIERGVISYKSPLGKALLGAAEGEKRYFIAPKGRVEVQVLKILPDKAKPEEEAS